MTIFFDDEMFHREARGGVTRYVAEAAHALARHQHVPVTVFGGWSQNRTVQELARRGISNLDVFHCHWPAGSRCRALARALSKVWRRTVFRQLRRACDTVIYHPSLYAFDPVIAASASALVLTVHDMQLEVFQEATTHARRHVPLKRSAIEAADWIFCVSRHTAEDLHRLVPSSHGKTQVVYNDSSVTAPSPDSPTGHPCGNQPYFLIVGTRKGYKNGRAALQAFARIAGNHPNLRLVVCGPRPGPDAEEFGETPPAAVRERIHWLRPEDGTLASCYAHASGLLYPSSYEGFGLPVLEAMRCGCPVVTCRTASIPEVAGEAALYVHPEPDAIAAAMEQLLREPALGSRLRRAGFVQAEEFSWRRSSGLMVQGYHNALARRSQVHIRASTVDFANVL